MPSVVMFSPNAPGSTVGHDGFIFSMLSLASRLTWRCQGPAWASPSTPCSTTRVMDSTGCLRTPFASATLTETTVPSTA